MSLIFRLGTVNHHSDFLRIREVMDFVAAAAVVAAVVATVAVEIVVDTGYIVRELLRHKGSEGPREKNLRVGCGLATHW